MRTFLAGSSRSAVLELVTDVKYRLCPVGLISWSQGQVHDNQPLTCLLSVGDTVLVADMGLVRPAGIGRLVAAAQAREAPVQRVADAVAGKFCYGVMAASAATFTFWQMLGK